MRLSYSQPIRWGESSLRTPAPVSCTNSKRAARHCFPSRILEGKQWRAARSEFVHETGAGVRKEDSPQRIGCEYDRRIQLSGAVALVAPRAEEFERGQLR